MPMRTDGPAWGELNQEVEAGSQEKGPEEVSETESKIVMAGTREGEALQWCTWAQAGRAGISKFLRMGKRAAYSYLRENGDSLGNEPSPICWSNSRLDPGLPLHYLTGIFLVCLQPGHQLQLDFSSLPSGPQ